MRNSNTFVVSVPAKLRCQGLVHTSWIRRRTSGWNFVQLLVVVVVVLVVLVMIVVVSFHPVSFSGFNSVGLL